MKMKAAEEIGIKATHMVLSSSINQVEVNNKNSIQIIIFLYNPAIFSCSLSEA